MSQTKAQLVSGTTAQDLTVDNINTTSINSGQTSGRKNLIINGAMQVAQRGTSSTANDSFSVDRFENQYSGVDAGPTFAQVDVASGTSPYTNNFRKALKITNADQSSGAGSSDMMAIVYKFEAQDIANSGWNYLSNSSYITLSYWVKSSIAQNFYGRFQSVDGTSQNYPFETGSLSADTWTKITKTIPGNSNLQFDNDVNHGLTLELSTFRGTDKTGSIALDAWNAYGGGTTRTPDQTSTWYTTNGATFEITGVQLEVGSTATDFEHRRFGEELVLCQRYCQVFGGLTNYTLFGTGVWKSSTAASIGTSFMTKMRTQPSFSVASPTSSMIRSGGSNIDVTSVALDINTTENVMYNVNVSSGGTNGHGAMFLGKGNTDTTITLSAEL